MNPFWRAYLLQIGGKKRPTSFFVMQILGCHDSHNITKPDVFLTNVEFLAKKTLADRICIYLPAWKPIKSNQSIPIMPGLYPIHTWIFDGKRDVLLSSCLFFFLRVGQDGYGKGMNLGCPMKCHEKRDVIFPICTFTGGVAELEDPNSPWFFWMGRSEIIQKRHCIVNTCFVYIYDHHYLVFPNPS